MGGMEGGALGSVQEVDSLLGSLVVQHWMLPLYVCVCVTSSSVPFSKFTQTLKTEQGKKRYTMYLDSFCLFPLFVYALKELRENKTGKQCIVPILSSLFSPWTP